MDHLLEGLTEAQREAVLHVEGPLLILAGPGSGKTRVVTHRIARLIDQGIPGNEILALTFTNKAAAEMRDRVERLSSDPTAWLGTYHRFCAQLLREYAQFVGIEGNYTIYDTDDSSKTLRRIMAEMSIDTAQFQPDRVGRAISWAKNNLITPQKYRPQSGHPMGEIVAEVYPAYQRRLIQSNAVDFDDLLIHVSTLLRDNEEVRRTLDEKYRFILVDEYQDTNLAQYAIARALSIDHPNLAVTGDPDQSIYGWRGANLNNILEFEKDYPKVRVVRLEQNYRSTKRILRVASGLIAHNVRRKQKALFTDNDAGPPVRMVTYGTHKDEAEGIVSRIVAEVRAGRRRPRDFAIFFRVNALSRALEFALRQQNVPYQLVSGVEFFQRREIKDVLAYLKLLSNPRDDVSLLRVINAPARGIGKTTLNHLAAHANQRGLSLLDAAREVGQIDAIARRGAAALTGFVGLFDRMEAAAEGPMEEILGLVLTETDFRKQFRDSNTEEDQQRLANIEELLTVAREFDERHDDRGGLDAFLEETSLVNETDGWEEDTDRVTLMTLHASKGLEFPMVFLVAVEEGLLPHDRSRDNPDQLEEERRLLFVGITRAEEELQISRAEIRDFRGQRKMTVPSSFMMELPRDDMELVGFGSGMSGWRMSAYDRPHAAPTPPPRAARPVASRPGGHLTTAAELAGNGPAPALAPDRFAQGMIVRHPNYGLGKIIALSGSGTGRKATIDFPPPVGRKKFVLESSPLRPVRMK